MPRAVNAVLCCPQSSAPRVDPPSDLHALATATVVDRCPWRRCSSKAELSEADAGQISGGTPSDFGPNFPIHSSDPLSPRPCVPNSSPGVCAQSAGRRQCGTQYVSVHASFPVRLLRNVPNAPRSPATTSIQMQGPRDAPRDENGRRRAHAAPTTLKAALRATSDDVSGGLYAKHFAWMCDGRGGLKEINPDAVRTPKTGIETHQPWEAQRFLASHPPKTEEARGRCALPPSLAGVGEPRLVTEANNSRLTSGVWRQPTPRADTCRPRPQRRQSRGREGGSNSQLSCPSTAAAKPIPQGGAPSPERVVDGGRHCRSLHGAFGTHAISGKAHSVEPRRLLARAGLVTRLRNGKVSV